MFYFFVVVNIALFYAINLILLSAFGSNLPETIMKALTPALSAVDSLWFMLAVIIITHLLWFVGVHGAAIMDVIIAPFFVQNIMANAAAKVAGQPMEFIWTDPLWSLVVKLGGSGATLALAVLMLRSKSSQLKAVGKVGILPGLFNINEPILFGTLIILNPIMFIPLILAPCVNGIIGYFSVKLGLVGRAFVAVPWTTPAFIGLPLATLDWKAFVLVVVCFFIDMAIYYPFFKSYEKLLVEFQNIVLQIVSKIIIPIIPLFITSTFATLAYQGSITTQLPIFLKAIVIVIIGHFIWLTVLYSIAGAMSGKNPARVFKSYEPSAIKFVLLPNTRPIISLGRR